MRPATMYTCKQAHNAVQVHVICLFYPHCCCWHDNNLRATRIMIIKKCEHVGHAMIISYNNNININVELNNVIKQLL